MDFEFLEKIKTMDLDNLFIYDTAAGNILKVINLLGIGACFIALWVATLTAYIPVSIAVFLLAKCSIVINSTRFIIRERIIKLSEDAGLI